MRLNQCVTTIIKRWISNCICWWVGFDIN